MVTLGRGISLGLLLCWMLVGRAQNQNLESISLSTYPIYEVSQDSSGKIWMATGNGLYNWTPLGGFQPLSDQEYAFLDVRKVHHRDSGAWVLTTQGLFQLSKTQTLIPHGLKDLRENRILNVVEDDEGNTWFLGLNQVFLLQPDATQKVWTLGEIGIGAPLRLISRSGSAILISEDSWFELDATGAGTRRSLDDLPVNPPDYLKSPDGSLRIVLEPEYLAASLVENEAVSRNLPVSAPIKNGFQDSGGNIWLSFETERLEVLTAETFKHLAGSMRLEYNLELKAGEKIEAIAGHDHRVAILTSANRLFWCNRLEAKAQWQLERMEDPEIFLTHQHILIRDQETITLFSLNSKEKVSMKVPDLSQVASAGEIITVGINDEIYGRLNTELLDRLLSDPDPALITEQLIPEFSQVFARKVLFLPDGGAVVLKDRELEYSEVDSMASPSLKIFERFQEVIHWRGDTLLGKTVSGNLILLTPENQLPVDLPFLEGGMLSRIAVAPENNLIWMCDGHNIWLSVGVAGLISQNSACLVHFPMTNSSAAWDRYLLGDGAATKLALMISEEPRTPDGDLFIRCVRWAECMKPWQGNRIISQDSTIFSIEFESTVLFYPFDQTIEVKINDQDWQVAENSTFTLPQFNTGRHKISARLRAGGVILAQKDEILLFSIRTPFYQSWWFVFIGLVMLAGLIWAGLTLYYGENERKQLEIQVQDRTRDLDRFVHELKQKNEDLEQFAYIASHDLKSPLRGVIGHLQLFLRKNQDHIDQAGKDSINFAIAESKRLYEMVNDLLDFASVGSGKIDKKLVVMDRLLESVRQSILLQRRGQPGEIILHNYPQIHAVPSQFEALFRNLIENGLKFNESDRSSVTITYEETSELHRFRVQDNGIGMNEAYIEKAFELYGRLNPDYPGTGIGLAICRRVVERHGGILALEQSGPSGSVFLISLPKIEGEILA